MPEEINPAVREQIMKRIGSAIVTKAIRASPIDTGILRSKIKYEIDGNILHIICDVPYAQDMEYGTPPGELNDSEKENLTGWADRHKASAKRIIKYIEKEGIKVGTPENPMHITSYGRNSYRPFMRPAILQTIANVDDLLKGI